jgi:SAM-dependent methyltransferase
VPWSLEQAYDAYPRIEEEFSAVLDQSLDPRGPDLLYDLVARLGLAPGAVALDVGCGEGRQALALHQRFGFRVTGIDPVPRHIEVARAAAGPDGPVFEVGTAEDIPAGPDLADLVWCRDVLVHVRDLPRAYAEFRRVLRPGGYVVVYQMFGSELLEPREAAWACAARRRSGVPDPPARRGRRRRPQLRPGLLGPSAAAARPGHPDRVLAAAGHHRNPRRARRRRHRPGGPARRHLVAR